MTGDNDCVVLKLLVVPLKGEKFQATPTKQDLGSSIQ